MDKETMRQQMEAIRAELAQNEQEHEALKTMLLGYEAWFRANSEGSEIHQLEMAVAGNRPRGTISFRRALIQVLQQAHGAPMLDDEIWERMQALGARSASKRPVGFIGLHAKREAEIEKVAPRTFRWVELKEDEQ